MRMYVGHCRGVRLCDIAGEESVTSTRVYQIIAATEYQLNKGNPDYWEAYKKATGSYNKVQVTKCIAIPAAEK